jgi:hypothetical protein
VPEIVEPKAEQALARVADLLSDLSGVRPGGWSYERTPGVSRVLPPLGYQMPADQLPRLFVTAGKGSKLSDEPGKAGGVRGGSRLYVYALHVDVHGVVTGAPYGTTGIAADTWLQRLREDVVVTLHGHPTLDGLAKMIDFTDRPEDVDQVDLAPHAWFLVPCTVWLEQAYATTPN